MRKLAEIFLTTKRKHLIEEMELQKIESDTNLKKERDVYILEIKAQIKILEQLLDSNRA